MQPKLKRRLEPKLAAKVHAAKVHAVLRKQQVVVQKAKLVQKARHVQAKHVQKTAKLVVMVPWRATRVAQKLEAVQPASALHQQLQRAVQVASALHRLPLKLVSASHAQQQRLQLKLFQKTTKRHLSL